MTKDMSRKKVKKKKKKKNAVIKVCAWSEMSLKAVLEVKNFLGEHAPTPFYMCFECATCM